MKAWRLKKGCFGISIRTLVHCGFVWYIIHGTFITIFAFSNTAYPAFLTIDYLFGGSGASLILVSVLGMMFASLQKYQFLRSIWALIVVLNILLLIITSFIYTTTRWNDVIVTIFARLRRPNSMKDFYDPLWFALAVISCIIAPFLAIFLVFIVSYMCNKWRTYLFSETYDMDVYPNTTSITVPSTEQSNAYPTQSK